MPKKEEEVPSGMRSPALSVAGSCVSSTSLTPSELEDRQTERALRLQQATLVLEEAKLALAAEEKKAAAEVASTLALEEKRLDLEEKRILLAHKMSQKELDLKAKKITASSDDDCSNTEVPRRGKRAHISIDLVPSFMVGMTDNP